MSSRRLLRPLLVGIVATALVFAFASSAFATGLSVHSPVTVTVRGHVYSIGAVNLLTDSGVSTPTVTAWVGQIAHVANTKPVNATRTASTKTHKFVFVAARPGVTVNQAASVAAICDELNAEIGGASYKTVALPVTLTSAKVTTFGTGIIVVLSQHRIYLWNGTKLTKTYKCAIGKAQYPTPTGTFYIGKKIKNPTWTNPGSAWAKGMPSYIGASPNNPLGTRAMYVYGKSGDTGVRFHGVPPSESSSIGHASSHGCMRMKRKDVEDFYPRVPLKTPVYIQK